MIKKIENSFRLIDSSTTHNQVLFRALEYTDNKHVGNVDVLFDGVKLLLIPFDLEIKSVHVANEDEVMTIIEQYGLVLPEGKEKIFIIEGKSNNYFVIAMRMLTQRNNLGPEETSIPSKKEKPLAIDDIMKMGDEIQHMLEKGDVKDVVDKYMTLKDWEEL